MSIINDHSQTKGQGGMSKEVVILLLKQVAETDQVFLSQIATLIQLHLNRTDKH